MKRRYPHRLTLAAAVFCCLGLTGVQARTDTQVELDAALKKIDTELYKQSEADLRAFLDRLIETYWRPGGKDFAVSFDCGGQAVLAPMLLRAYEMLGDQKYRKAGLDFADALLQIQRPDGLFPSTCILRRGRKSSPGAGPRFEDEHNFVPFAVVVYAYKVSGDEKYLKAARRHADMVLSIQDPAKNSIWRGGWPLAYNGPPKPRQHAARFSGYVINDYTTYDGMRTMIMMYFLTRDKKYIERIQLLPKWHIEAQLGIGNVRAWGDQYDAYNQPTWERNFESPMIEPRMFNRCVAPVLMYFYAVTGDEVYRNLLFEGRDWLRSVEAKPGWASEYTFDGRPSVSEGYRVRILDPQDRFAHVTSKVILETINPVIELIKRDGRKGLRAWYGPRPTRYDKKQYLAARLAAARRVTDERRVVRLWSMKEHAVVQGKFLERVRSRPLNPKGLARKPYDNGYFWRFWRPVQPKAAPPRGWAAWQYVWDVRVARGEIDADTAAWGGRGIEGYGAPTWFFEPWDMAGDWSTLAVEVEDWLDIPLKPPVVHVTGAGVEPVSMSLEAGKEREITLVLKPKDATCKTAIWTSSDEAVAKVAGRMLDKIDPKASRPHFRTGGKLFVVAGKPGKATITVTTTDGHRRARCMVTVTK